MTEAVAARCSLTSHSIKARRIQSTRPFASATTLRTTVTLVLLSVSLCSCVEIKSYKLAAAESYEGVSSAIPYVLPKATFLLTATYTLACSNDGTRWIAQITPQYSVTQVNLPDENERYYVKSDDLKSLLKDSQVTINTNPNQTLAGINGTVNDLVGPTVATAIGTAASIAGAVAVAGVPVGALFSYQPNKVPLHNTPPPAAAALTCAAPLNGDTAQALKQIRALRKKIADRLADPSKPSATTDPQIGIFTNQISAILGRSLTIKTSYLWMPYPVPALAKGKPAVPAPAEAPHLTANFDDTQLLAEHWFSDKTPLAVVRSFATLLLPNQLELRFLPWSYLAAGAAPASGTTEGFVIRNPAVATLRVCGDICKAPSVDSHDSSQISFDNTTTVAEYDNINVPQFGRRLIIPFRNIALQNTTIALTLGPDGSITSLGTHDTGTANTTLATLGTSAQAVGGAFTAQSSAISARNAAVTAAGTYADTILKAQADCLTQRSAIIAAGATPLMECNSP